MYRLYWSRSCGQFDWKVCYALLYLINEYKPNTQICLFSRSWSISKNDSRYNLYKTFIEVVTLTTYENLQQYSQFVKASFLDELDMLQIAKEV